MWKSLAALLVAFTALTTHLAYASAVVPIDTLPKEEDATSFYPTFVSFQWFDVAVGFTVPTHGTIRHITTSLYARPSFGSFYVGIASNELIGNPAEPSYFSPPPGSLADYSVCSNVLILDLAKSACDMAGGGGIALGADEPLEIVLDLFLPNAGTYWIYTRFQRDDVFATWITNNSIQTDLIAIRTGTCTGENPGYCNRIAERTFFLADGPRSAPGLRVEYEPGLRIPEPGIVALLAIGFAGLAICRRKRKVARESVDRSGAEP